MTKEKKILLKQLLKQYKISLNESNVIKIKRIFDFNINTDINNKRYDKDKQRIIQLQRKRDLSISEKAELNNLINKISDFDNYVTQTIEALKDQLNENFDIFYKEQQKYVKDSLDALYKSYK